MKNIFISAYCLLLFISSSAQEKVESISIEWPAEYEWKIVHQEVDGNKQVSMIIPGKETIKNPSILGSLTTYSGMQSSNMEDVIKKYKGSLGNGSLFTLIGKEKEAKFPWIIFKIETPQKGNLKPESDLYFVIQGQFALYECYVAIREPLLTEDFVKRWLEIFKSSKITLE